MPFYHKLGNIPHKRHTQFEKPGGGFYYEQLFGTEGFHELYVFSEGLNPFYDITWLLFFI